MTKQEIENILYKKCDDINGNLPSDCYFFKDEIPMYAEILATLSTQEVSVYGAAKILDTTKEIIPYIASF